MFFQEASLYIANIRDKFGAFHFATEKVVFDVELRELYIMQMIPGVAKDCNKSECEDYESMGECSYAPPAKKVRIADVTNNCSLVPIDCNQSTQTDRSDNDQSNNDQSNNDQSNNNQSNTNESAIQVSNRSTQSPVEHKPCISNGNNSDRSNGASTSGLCQGFEQIDSQLSNVITVVSDLKNAFKTPVDVFKNERTALIEAHAQEMAALKEAHQHVIAMANDAARAQVTALEQTVDELKAQVETEKKRTLDAQRLAQRYRDALDDIGKKVHATTEESH